MSESQEIKTRHEGRHPVNEHIGAVVLTNTLNALVKEANGIISFGLGYGYALYRRLIAQGYTLRRETMTEEELYEVAAEIAEGIHMHEIEGGTDKIINLVKKYRGN